MKMYFGKYRKKIFSIATVLLAVILIVCCCAMLFSVGDNALAFTSDSLKDDNIVDLGDILLSGYENRSNGKVFKSDVMSAIYKALTGKANATLDDVNKLSALTAAQIRDKNTGKDLIITLDGKKWTVTHFTKDTDGNPIVTLMLATSSTACTWNLWSENTAAYAYPSSMYSSSYIRASVLNSGNGYVATAGANTLTKITQSDTHNYAKLTMQSVKGSLTSFIVTPSKVEYQGTENHYVDCPNGLGSTLINDAYGTPKSPINYYSSVTEYLNKSGYNDWKDDYIWLPSITEVGYGDNVAGIWALSANQRCNPMDSWLRSGVHHTDASRAYMLMYNGTGGSPSVNREQGGAARPAFHLNLRAADSSSARTLSVSDFNVTYDGTSKSISSASWYNKDK
ncbi:MAG: hypothetical protein K2I79_01570, partial [Clostridia bacterium]|nr:hypothetical protein [Clostridia bacterium]